MQTTDYQLRELSKAGVTVWHDFSLAPDVYQVRPGVAKAKGFPDVESAIAWGQDQARLLQRQQALVSSLASDLEHVDSATLDAWERESRV